MLKRLLRPSAFKVALAIGVVFAGLHLWSVGGGQNFDRDLGFLQLLEKKAVDVKFKMRGPLPLSHKVALAEVDEKSIGRYGLWPWNRAVLAKAIAHLAEAGAGSMALDIVVSNEDRNSAFKTLTELRSHFAPPDPDADKKLNAAMESLAPAARQSLQPAMQSVLAEHHAAQETFAQLTELTRRSPEQELHDVVEKYGDQLVLGAIGYNAADLDRFTPAELAAWKAQMHQSVIPGGYELVGSHPKALPPQRWSLWSYAAIEPWRAEVASADQQFAFFSTKPDKDGTMRVYNPVRLYEGGFVPSLAMAAVARPTGFPPSPLRSPIDPATLDGVGVDSGGKFLVVPTDPFDGSRMLINYVAPNSSWHSASERDAAGKPYCTGADCDRVSLADAVDGTFDPAIVKGKVVFLSVTAVGTFDQRVTPYDDFSPGVYIHMNVAEDVISQRFLDSGAQLHLVELAVLLLMAVVFGLALPRMHLGGQLATLPLGMGGYLGANLYLFGHGTQFFTVTPLLEIALLTFGLVFFQYFTVDKEKRQVRTAFQFYLTESVMKEMLDDPSKLKLGGEKRNLTVLFSDIRGFTTLSEMLEPGEVVRRLNEYLTPMTNLVFKTGGTLDKYMGDAIMAFWGAPSNQPDHALRACETAVAMLGELDALRARWKASGEADIDIGIGLNSGNIHVGNMGSDNRFDYTVIGDDVNLASRLEGTNKSYGTRVIIGENTYQQVKGKVVSRELGGVMVKGKKKPVTIYELRRVGTPNAEEAANIAAFERGLTAYRAREWDAAEAAFHEVQKTWLNDGPSDKYLEDIADKRVHPPDAGWDGVYVMKTK